MHLKLSPHVHTRSESRCIFLYPGFRRSAKVAKGARVDRAPRIVLPADSPIPLSFDGIGSYFPKRFEELLHTPRKEI